MLTYPIFFHPFPEKENLVWLLYSLFLSQAFPSLSLRFEFEFEFQWLWLDQQRLSEIRLSKQLVYFLKVSEKLVVFTESSFSVLGCLLHLFYFNWLIINYGTVINSVLLLFLGQRSFRSELHNVLSWMDLSS